MLRSLCALALLGLLLPSLAQAQAPASWHRLSPSGAGPDLSGGYGLSFAYDGETNALYGLKYRGFSEGELWKFDLVTGSWTLIPTTNWPLNGGYSSFVFDPASGDLMMWASGIGEVYSVQSSGGAWILLGGGPNLSTHFNHAYTFAPEEGVLAYGGYGFSTVRSDLHRFDHSVGAWEILTTLGDQPYPRTGAGAALDADEETLFILGGEGNASGWQPDGYYGLRDLWQLDLPTLTWTSLLSLGVASISDVGSSAALDPSEGVLYAFGGRTAAAPHTYSNTVSSFALGSSTDFSAVSTTGAAPSPREGAFAFWDESSERLIVAGGHGPVDGTLIVHSDVWALDYAPVNVAMSVPPPGPPVVVEPGAGSFSFDVTVTSASEEPQVFDGWTEVVLPDGRTISPLIGPQRFTLDAGEVLGPITMEQRVPASAPAGMYTYRVRVGTYPFVVLASDSFLIERLTGETGPRTAQDSAQVWDTMPWDQLASPTTVVSGVSATAPPALRLSPAHPNPFHTKTRLTFEVTTAQQVQVEVFDTTGRLVARLHDGMLEPSRAHSITLESGRLPAGIYLVRVTGEAFTVSETVALVR